MQYLIPQRSSNTSRRTGPWNFNRTLRSLWRKWYVQFLSEESNHWLISLSQFIARFMKLRNEKLTASAPKPKTTKKKQQNMDDTDSEDSSDEEPEVDNAQPWLHEWTLYTTTHDIVPENVGIVRWWGVRSHVFISIFHCSGWCARFNLAQRPSLSNVGVSCSWLSRYHGVICFQWARIFFGRYYDWEAP